MRDACEAFSILTIRHDGRAGVNEFRPYPWVHIRHDCPAGSILYASFCVSSKMMRNNRPIVARFTPPISSVQTILPNFAPNNAKYK